MDGQDRTLARMTLHDGAEGVLENASHVAWACSEWEPAHKDSRHGFVHLALGKRRGDWQTFPFSKPDA